MLFRTATATIASAAALTGLVAVLTGAWNVAVFGGALAFTGAVAGLILVHRAVSRRAATAHKQTNRVLGAVVISILVRVVLLGGGLAFAMVVLGFDPVAFIAAFFLVHLFSQVLEIRYVHRAGRLSDPFETA
jgi:hypothetical protein